MITLFIRTVFLYLVLIAVIRFLGKRQLGQLEPSEVVVMMVVADLASISMQDETVPVLSSIIPIGTVFATEFILSELSMRSVKLRKLLCGKPVILVENGRFLQDNMRRTRVTLDELTSQLREKDVMDITTVQYAILETGGSLSVFLYPENQPVTPRDLDIKPEKQAMPITIITDGRVITDNLKKAGRDEKWLQKELKRQKSSLQKTFLLTVDETGKVCFFPKE